jgi:hypothetical protein
VAWAAELDRRVRDLAEGLGLTFLIIAVAVAEGRGQVRALGTTPSRPEAVRRLLGNVGKVGEEARPSVFTCLPARARPGARLHASCEVLAMGCAGCSTRAGGAGTRARCDLSDERGKRMARRR